MLSVRSVCLKCSAHVYKYLCTYQNSPPGLWFLEKGIPINLESQAGEIGGGIERTSGEKVSSSPHAAMRFSSVSVTRKSKVISNIKPTRCQADNLLFWGWERLSDLPKVTQPGELGFELKSTRLSALPSHCTLLLLTVAVTPFQGSWGVPWFPYNAIAKCSELPERNYFTL